MIKKLQVLYYYIFDMKDYGSPLFHLTPFGGFIQQFIEKQWNTINLIKYTDLSASLNKSSPRYLIREVKATFSFF